MHDKLITVDTVNFSDFGLIGAKVNYFVGVPNTTTVMVATSISAILFYDYATKTIDHAKKLDGVVGNNVQGNIWKDTKYFMSLDSTGWIRVWNLETQLPYKKVLEYPLPISKIVFTYLHNGNIAIFSESYNGRITDYEMDEEIYAFSVSSITDLSTRRVFWEQLENSGLGLTAEEITDLKIAPSDFSVVGFGTDSTGAYTISGSMTDLRRVIFTKTYTVSGTTKSYDG